MFCPHCGTEATEKFCPKCGASMAVTIPNGVPQPPVVNQKVKKSIFKKWWFWVIVVVVFLGAVGSSTSGTDNNDGGNNDTSTSTSQNSVQKNDNKFGGDCGISASAEMGSSIINYPTVNISMTNTSGKDISAVQFYFVPLDVYGEEITGWTSQNKLYTDTAIPAGKSTSVEFQFIEDSVKKGKLYIYSVYFADGTEWGNKDATKSVIMKNGVSVPVEGVS